MDDEACVAESLRRVLSGEFEVTSTTDPEQALTWLESSDWYDVILCDVAMPTMSGIELRNRVHAARPEVAARIVFVTGGILREGVRALLEGMPNTVLAKPFDPDDLRELVRRRVASDPLPGRASGS